MNLINDKVNQGLIRITYARNELRFCESILSEKEDTDKLYEDNNFSKTFYSENKNTLDNLYYINLRMAITDLYTLVVENEKNSFIKVNNALRYTPKMINKFDKLNDYLCTFDKEITKYNDINDSIKTIRNVYVAHTDGIKRRVEFKDVSINLYELKDLSLFLFAYYLNIQSFLNNTFSGNLSSLFTFEHVGNGSNNTFEKMRIFYKKSIK